MFVRGNICRKLDYVGLGVTISVLLQCCVERAIRARLTSRCILYVPEDKL